MTSPPGFEQIAQSLRGALVAGRLGPGQQIDSESRLCQAFGVCRVTVRKALTQLQSEGLLHSRRGKGWFVLDTQRARRPTGVIGLLLGDMFMLDHPVGRQFIAGARDVLIHTPYHLQIMVVNCTEPAAARSRQVQVAGLDADLIDHQRLDGLIVLAREATEADVIRIAAHIPVAWGDHGSIPPRVVGAEHDCSGGAYDAARHLLSLGHRHVALLTVPLSVQQGRDQATGVQLAYREASAQGEARVTVLCGPRNRSEFGRQLTEQALAMPDRPSAIICGSDDLALGAWQAIDAAQLRVPRDLSLIGWNDTISTEQVPVPLTTIYTDHAARSAVLTQALLDVMAQRRTINDTAPQIVPTRLIVRQSTAAPPHSASRPSNTSNTRGRGKARRDSRT